MKFSQEKNLTFGEVFTPEAYITYGLVTGWDNWRPYFVITLPFKKFGREHLWHLDETSWAWRRPCWRFSYHPDRKVWRKMFAWIEIP